MSQSASPDSRSETRENHMGANAHSMDDFPLITVPIGNECVLSHINSDLIAPDIKRRLAELGLRPGVHVSVVQKTSGGGRVIRIHNTRYALDRRTASSIKVHSVKTGGEQ